MSVEYRHDAFAPPRAARVPAPEAPALRFEIAWLDPQGRERWDDLRLPAGPAAEDAVALLASGTPVETPRGAVAVEDLIPGDRVRTVEGSATVTWIGRRLHHAAGPRPTLLRVGAGAFGRDRPEGHVVLGGAAHMRVEGPRCRPLVGGDAALAPVASLVDSLGVVAVRPPGDVATYGIACEGAATLLCAGLPVAAYHPARDMMRRLTPAALEDMARLIPPLASGMGSARLPYLSATEARMLSA